MNTVCYVASAVGNGIVSRAKNAFKTIPLAIGVILAVPATAVGLVATPFAAVGRGKVKSLNWLAELSDSSTLILPNIFTVAMEILNPNCKISRHNRVEGYLHKRVHSKANAIFFDLKKTNNTFFKSEICSRLFAAICIPIGVVVKVADGVLAVPAVAISVVTFGSIPKVNQFAYDNLRSFSAIPNNISCGVRIAVNPHLITPPRQKRD